LETHTNTLYNMEACDEDVSLIYRSSTDHETYLSSNISIRRWLKSQR